MQPCSHCGRHLKAASKECPFCGGVARAGAARVAVVGVTAAIALAGCPLYGMATPLYGMPAPTASPTSTMYPAPLYGMPAPTATPSLQP